MASQFRKSPACLPCRRSKIKCLWQPDELHCQRCAQIGRECTRGIPHVGRQKGTKNKRVGLDKSLFQIEQAVKRAQVAETVSAEDERIVRRLAALLAGGDCKDDWSVEGHQNGSSPSRDSAEVDEMDGDMTEDNPISGDVQTIESAESPLQLLAASHRASERRVAIAQAEKSSELRSFFSPVQAVLDIGDDVDPISLGLISEEEAQSLVIFFHDNLSHTRWGLDSRIYDMAFIRSRSAFLLTSVMAASALFMPHAGPLYKRLSNHVRTLVHKIVREKNKSVEIVLAFLVNLPWMPPGKRSTDDETCFYVSTATQMAIDLALHKVPTTDEAVAADSRACVGRSECINARIALAIDGYRHVDPLSRRGRVLLRSRERCWISLFVVERGMCLARGRPFTVPLTRLIRACDGWHRSDLADKEDGPLLCVATMRRDLDGLFDDVRALCDGTQATAADGSLVAHAIEKTIEQFFDRWHAEYDSSIGSGPDLRLPPYTEILVTHTRLSIYGGLINHPTAPLEVRQFFRTAGLSSALNVMRVAIQGESRLLSMPNNTAIMISFAACFALTLSVYVTENSTLAPSIRELIDQTVGVLERIGSVTPHRNGPSILYGKQLRRILKERSATAVQETERGPEMASAPMKGPEARIQHENEQDSFPWPDTFQFSAMSDMDIARILNQPGNGFEACFDGITRADFDNFDWLHWPDSI